VVGANGATRRRSNACGISLEIFDAITGNSYPLSTWMSDPFQALKTLIQKMFSLKVDVGTAIAST
jgi:hypothetical protein